MKPVRFRPTKIGDLFTLVRGIIGNLDPTNASVFYSGAMDGVGLFDMVVDCMTRYSKNSSVATAGINGKKLLVGVEYNHQYAMSLLNRYNQIPFVSIFEGINLSNSDVYSPSEINALFSPTANLVEGFGSPSQLIGELAKDKVLIDYQNTLGNINLFTEKALDKLAHRLSKDSFELWIVDGSPFSEKKLLTSFLGATTKVLLLDTNLIKNIENYATMKANAAYDLTIENAAWGNGRGYALFTKKP